MIKRIFGFFLIIVLGSGFFLKYFIWREPPRVKGPLIDIYLTLDHKSRKMFLEEYLVGVLAAEMPAAFSKEALKAQAITARTYTLKKLFASEKSANKVHPQGVVCTDPKHCQGWFSAKEMQKKWGTLRSRQYEKKFKEAVKATTGQVLKYEQNLIDPVYHSTCGGQTENGEDVWVCSLPYLTSVSCPWCGESPRYQQEKTFSWAELNRRLGLALKEGELLPDTMEKLAETKTGRLKMIKVGEKVFTGVEIRNLLGLNSTNFTWRIQEEGIVFLTKGYGHGVGMCQYGANGLAQKGFSAEEILKHYYPGVYLESIY